MKKEWIYFIAGAGLAVAIMSATIWIQGDNYSDYKECMLRETQKYQTEPNYSILVDYCLRDHSSSWEP